MLMYSSHRRMITHHGQSWLTEQTNRTEHFRGPVRFVRVRRHTEQNRTVSLFGSCSADFRTLISMFGSVRIEHEPNSTLVRFGFCKFELYQANFQSHGFCKFELHQAMSRTMCSDRLVTQGICFVKVLMLRMDYVE
jgi:hypothetical protein